MNLQQVPKLQQIHRVEAQSRARIQVLKILGQRPAWETFYKGTRSEYPMWLTWGLSGLFLIIAFCAWGVSATRIAQVAYEESLHASNIEAVAIFIAAAGILSSELIVIASAVSRKVLFYDTKESTTGRRAMVGLAIFGTVFATSANFTITEAHIRLATITFENSPRVIFIVSEALMPIVVLGVSLAFEELILRDVRERQAALAEFDTVEKAWDQANEDAMQHPRWKGLYANELRDAITKANARRKLIPEFLAALTDIEWGWLVRREMATDDWFGDAADFEPEPVFGVSDHQREGTDFTEGQIDSRQQSPRPSPQVERALRHLEQYPEDANLSGRKLSELIGVGKDTANEAKAIFAKQQQEDTQETQAIEPPVLEQAEV